MLVTDFSKSHSPNGSSTLPPQDDVMTRKLYLPTKITINKLLLLRYMLEPYV